MIKYCKEKWAKNNKKLEEALRHDKTLNSCGYNYLVELIVEHILNDETNDYSDTWDSDNITMIDNGDYQGTLLFLIPTKTYQPPEYEYLMTFVSYGSCSGCDTLLSIQDYWHDNLPTENQIKDFMTLCRYLVCNMIKPYQCGWRNDSRFDVVEEEVENDEK